MAETVKGTAERIRKLQVQGARNVAIAAVKAIQTQAEQTQAKRREALSCAPPHPFTR
jgi:translation initiation factor 2B subunit (eIF-2B alpha/beta/delta family)